MICTTGLHSANQKTLWRTLHAFHKTVHQNAEPQNVYYLIKVFFFIDVAWERRLLQTMLLSSDCFHRGKKKKQNVCLLGQN